jgi:thermitase
MKYEYKVQGKKVALEVDPSVVAVRFKEPAPYSMRAMASEAAEVGPFAKRVEVPGEKFTIVPVAAVPKPQGQKHPAAMRALDAQPSVSRVAPVFKVGSNQVLATDRLIIGVKEGGKLAASVLQKNKLTKLSESQWNLVVQLPEDADPFELCKKLEGEPGVEYVEPDFVTIGRHVPNRAPEVPARAAGDPMVGQQYAMAITQTTDAWTLQSGNPAIKIAILDEGVDTGHVDLKAAIVGSFDGEKQDSFQEPNPWDGHGTACAGLAAAVPDNTIGIRGAGGGCSLLAVRIARSEVPGGSWKTSNAIISRSIDWSWQNGADVLSNSWGGGAPSNDIIAAFGRARTKGRNNKGCVVVIAAGNSAGPVTFPGTIGNVLTVSATNEFDEFKTTTSRDGENWWGSCFGPAISVGAPGVHNLTTDITGSGGYNKNGDFFPIFNGTSSATPIVAGICGLVLSANPDLTEAGVRNIITNAADKVGGQPYVKGRNDFLGFGRVNAQKAVRAAQTHAGLSMELAGTVRRLSHRKAKMPVFVLETGKDGAFVLKHNDGLEAGPHQPHETRSAAYFATFEGKKVKVIFTQKQEAGTDVPILWGAEVAAS